MSADKYRAACIAYAEAGNEVRRQKKAIGDHMNACWSAQQERHNKEHTDCDSRAPLIANHLEDAYKHESGEDQFGREVTVYTNHGGDVSAYLAERCEHCLAAHKAVQARKEARKQFGIAKRRISIMGKHATAGAIA